LGLVEGAIGMDRVQTSSDLRDDRRPATLSLGWDWGTGPRVYLYLLVRMAVAEAAHNKSGCALLVHWMARIVVWHIATNEA
jgi:hypothetical protein